MFSFLTGGILDFLQLLGLSKVGGEWLWIDFYSFFRVLVPKKVGWGQEEEVFLVLLTFLCCERPNWPVKGTSRYAAQSNPQNPTPIQCITATIHADMSKLHRQCGICGHMTTIRPSNIIPSSNMSTGSTMHSPDCGLLHVHPPQVSLDTS